MSYWVETEKGEVESYGTDSYAIECPYCSKDSEEEFICPDCNKHFEIRPKYKFLGFYVYTDDEQEGSNE